MKLDCALFTRVLSRLAPRPTSRDKPPLGTILAQLSGELGIFSLGFLVFGQRIPLSRFIDFLTSETDVVHDHRLMPDFVSFGICASAPEFVLTPGASAKNRALALHFHNTSQLFRSQKYGIFRIDSRACWD
jgi:hypothetical protein